MFKIGDFSKLSQVTVKTLRYYDEMGLLKPSQVDRFTGYRYYSTDQLPRLLRILALKDLGLSLEQIAKLLDEGLAVSQLRGMLRMKQAEIEQHVHEEQERLARVEARLRQIEKEGVMPAYDVILKRIDPLTIAGVRDVIPTYGDIGRVFGELFAYLGPRGIRPMGPTMGIYYDPEYRERDADVEAAVPVAGPPVSGDRVTVHQLPGVLSAACTVHQGSYENFNQAYAALMKWIEENGYAITGPNREIYLKGPESGSDPSAYMTEIQFPVEKA